MLKHIWNGKQKKAHIENIKPWSDEVENKTVNILLDAFLSLVQETAGTEEITSADAEKINCAAEDLKEIFLETARKHDIPVWFPTADNYEF